MLILLLRLQVMQHPWIQIGQKYKEDLARENAGVYELQSACTSHPTCAASGMRLVRAGFLGGAAAVACMS